MSSELLYIFSFAKLVVTKWNEGKYTFLIIRCVLLVQFNSTWLSLYFLMTGLITASTLQKCFICFVAWKLFLVAKTIYKWEYKCHTPPIRNFDFRKCKCLIKSWIINKNALYSATINHEIQLLYIRN